MSPAAHAEYEYRCAEYEQSANWGLTGTDHRSRRYAMPVIGNWILSYSYSAQRYS
ncbi:MAG: hypothetical protein U0795_08885 [Pirellulales bacterium]